MTILVGTDGTDWSMAAVEWAAIEAQRRRAPLRIVHAFDWDWHESRFDIGNEYIDVGRHLAEAVVAEATGRARECAPDIAIETDTLIGHATPCLLAAARDAELLVVGSRGRGGFAGLLLGSVSQRLATHAACPVAVIHHPQSDEPSRQRQNRIVVGVDGSEGSRHALGWALDEARLRQATLAAVHVRTRAFIGSEPVPAGDYEANENDRAGDVLESALASADTSGLAAPVEPLVVSGSTAAALLEASQDANLLVVGSRGHGGFAGLLLGSVSDSVVHRATCAVVVVPTGRERFIGGSS